MQNSYILPIAVHASDMSEFALGCRLVVQAIAAHSNNGLVIVQVERVVQKGSLNPRLVHIPAALVHKVAFDIRHWSLGMHWESMVNNHDQ